jgi:hypothetical protein
MFLWNFTTKDKEKILDASRNKIRNVQKIENPKPPAF